MRVYGMIRRWYIIAQQSFESACVYFQGCENHATLKRDYNVFSLDGGRNKFYYETNDKVDVLWWMGNW